MLFYDSDDTNKNYITLNIIGEISNYEEFLNKTENFDNSAGAPIYVDRRLKLRKYVRKKGMQVWYERVFNKTIFLFIGLVNHDEAMLEIVKSFKKPQIIKMQSADRKILHDFCLEALNCMANIRIANSYLMQEKLNFISKELLLKLSDGYKVRGLFPPWWSEELQFQYKKFHQTINKYISK